MNWNRVEKLWLVSFQLFYQSFNHQPVFIGRNRNNIQAVIGENLGSQEIRRLFDKDGISCLRKDRADQIQGRRHTVSNKNIFELNRHPIILSQELGKRQAEITIALFDAILQEGSITLLEAFFRGATKRI